MLTVVIPFLIGFTALLFKHSDFITFYMRNHGCSNFSSFYSGLTYLNGAVFFH